MAGARIDLRTGEATPALLTLPSGPLVAERSEPTCPLQPPGFPPAEDRPDPIGLLEDQAASRVPAGWHR